VTLRLSRGFLPVVLGFSFAIGCGSSGTTDGSGGSLVSSGGAASGGAVGAGGGVSGGAVGAGGSASGGVVGAGGAGIGGEGGGGVATGGAPAGGSATGGNGTGGQATEPAMVMNSSGTVTFTWGDRTLVVDGTTGARVTSLKAAAAEMLVPASTNASNDDFKNNYGSTFWTSPQTDWNWPPVVAIDSGAYTVTVDAGTSSATFKSASATVGTKNVTIEKKVSVDSTKDVITIDYSIAAVGSSVSMAPWEITRVKQGGLTFFMTGTKDFQPGTLPLLTLTKMASASWFQHAASSAEGKTSAETAEGWLAHADPTTQLLLIKSFENIAATDTEPNSGEVEIYASPPAKAAAPPEPALVPYVEVENQGKLSTIAAGMSAKYTVHWLLRPIPEGTSVAVGSAGLLDLVHAEVEKAGL
jgi:hypothetical protein